MRWALHGVYRGPGHGPGKEAGPRPVSRQRCDLPHGSVPWLHDFARWLASWVLRPAFRVRVHGSERIPAAGPVVLVANHSSLAEPQLIFGLTKRRTVFLVKIELTRG